MSSFCMARVRIEKNNPGEIELKKDAHAERERERERERKEEKDELTGPTGHQAKMNPHRTREDIYI